MDDTKHCEGDTVFSFSPLPRKGPLIYFNNRSHELKSNP
jgi:hypothetical protein